MSDREALLPAQRRHAASEQNYDPVSTGVNDPGRFQDGEQIRAASDRLFTCDHSDLEQVGNPQVLLLRARVGRHRFERFDRRRDSSRHVGHHGQDRSLRGFADGGVGAIGRALHRERDQHRVDEHTRPRDQLLGGSANQLREDYAAVAAGA